MTNSNKYIIIHCQHRSGSTALLNTLGQLPGVRIIPEEVNLVERDFVRNTIWRYAKNHWHDPTQIHGSIWTSDGDFYKNTQELITELQNFPSNDLGYFARVVLDRLTELFYGNEEVRTNRLSVACKYLVHVGFSDQLINSFPSAYHIVLVRDLGSVYLSKINDPEMRNIRRSNILRYFIKRLAILIFFSLDYRTVVKLATAAVSQPNCHVIRYSKMKYDLTTFAANNGFDFNGVESISEGKPSSKLERFSKPNLVELLLLRVLGGCSNFD